MTSNTGYDDAFLFWRKETYIVEVEIGEGWNKSYDASRNHLEDAVE